MLTFLLLLSLLNGDFSDGLNHWQADANWSATAQTAQVKLSNQSGIATMGSVLCSEPVSTDRQKTLTGTADVWQRGKGYVFAGVRWYDKNGLLLWDEWLSNNEGKPARVWQHLDFKAEVPKKARGVSFCFFTGAFAQHTYTARVDNASLQ